MMSTQSIFPSFGIKDKSQLASISGMCFTALAAFLYFTLWFGPWSITDAVVDKVNYTALAIGVAALAAIAVISKEYGTKSRDRTLWFITSFIYGVFPIIILSIVIWLVASGMTSMAGYVLISSFVSGLGTYLLLSSFSTRATAVR